MEDLNELANQWLFVYHPRDEGKEEYPILTARRLRTIKEREVSVDPDTVVKLVDGEFTTDSYKKHRSC